jgi:hypothetical protein
MTFQSALRTKIQGASTRTTWEDKRKKRILEALTWESGTQTRPRKHIVTTMPNSVEVYFLKPGKEVFNQKRPNPNDMLPVVGSPDVMLKFDDIWTYLSKVSVIDFDDFKAILIIIYRIAYFIDHVERSEGVIRYEPNREIMDSIGRIDANVGDVLPFRLMGLFHFLDLLGWNEDMKYHVGQGRPAFSEKGKINTGRINTLLTCIRVPYQASSFVTHCLNKANDRRNIDFYLLFTIMQTFAKSRGVCPPTQQQIATWLSPYVTE